MIPLVAASETGRAKTDIINFCKWLDASLATNRRASLGFRDVGVAGRNVQTPRNAKRYKIVSRIHWKVEPKTVIVR